MSKPQARNDIESAVPKFCFGLEVHRRTPDGRVRTAQEFLAHFFPHDKKSSTDRLFHYLPSDVRAPILTTWGVRGRKSALLDDDGKVQSVMHDALVAGDIDASMFEEALSADTIMRWIDLSDWWSFWRGGKITKYTILRALESAYELGLFDADWFLDTLRGHGGKLRGTDVLAEGLNKADLTEWVRRIHESGDGSPKGLLAALGWDQIVAKTADDILVAVLDAMAAKVSLVVPPPNDKDPTKVDPKQETKPADGKSDAKAEVKPADSKPEVKAEVKPADAKAEVKADTKVQAKVEAKIEAKASDAKDVKSESKLAAVPPKAETKVDSATMPKAEPVTAKSGGIVAAAGAKPAGTTGGAQLPGVLIPSTALHSDKPDEKATVIPPTGAQGIEESIDSESAANLFKDDELIPISSGAWDDGDDSTDDAADLGGTNRATKPPGKRASRTPPNPARGGK